MHLELRYRSRIGDRALFFFWSAVAVLSGVGLSLSLIPLAGALALVLSSQFLGRVVIVPTGAALLGAAAVRAIVKWINRAPVRNVN